MPLSVECSQEYQCLYGKIAYIRDLVNYEANDAKGLEIAFQEAVGSYLNDCGKLGKEPNVTFEMLVQYTHRPRLTQCCSDSRKRAKS